MPLWLAVGLVDWWCHRASNIEGTSGVRESVVHLFMFTQGGVALSAGLLLEINAGVIALFLILLLLHEVTAIYDLEYANPRRAITTLEQHMHSFLEAIPFMAMVLICCLHWTQTKALFTGAGAQFALEWKHQPLPFTYVAVIFIVAVLFDFGVYAEELSRCLKARRGNQAPL